jgi:hypothetical protein
MRHSLALAVPLLAHRVQPSPRQLRWYRRPAIRCRHRRARRAHARPQYRARGTSHVVHDASARPHPGSRQATMCNVITVRVDARLDIRADLCDPERVAPWIHGPAER